MRNEATARSLVERAKEETLRDADTIDPALGAAIDTLDEQRPPLTSTSSSSTMALASPQEVASWFFHDYHGRFAQWQGLARARFEASSWTIRQDAAATALEARLESRVARAVAESSSSSQS